MPRSVSLRQATRQDIDRIYQWRNDPEIYRWFRNQDEELDWHDHVEWFQNRPEDREDLIIEYMGGPVGVVALAADGDVGIYIGEKRLWGKGIASEALEKAIEDKREELSAEIHVDNTGSQKLFEKHGFERIGQEGEWIQYRRTWSRWDMENEHGFMQGDGSLHVEDR
ncbi:GNAT family N-acetyltransferase [Halopenitus sp. H-Gu1]|uniref:GNAT family N-acetyltransferase n=1 Tax=Halopenitus sp. H-Gu1 TaxID=3242697 RepID=UPI00359CFE55